MTRKEWLETFIRLCDTGAKILDFRRYCRVKAQHLPRHTKKLQQYRTELARLQAKEDETKKIEELRQKRLEALEEARRVRAEQAAKSKNIDSGSDSETVGPREDNSEE